MWLVDIVNKYDRDFKSHQTFLDNLYDSFCGYAQNAYFDVLLNRFIFIQKQFEMNIDFGAFFMPCIESNFRCSKDK